MDEELFHYGVPKKSGRYPWGSGAKWGKRKNDPGKSDKDSKKEKMKKEKKAQTEEEQRKKIEAKKKEVVESDDPALVYKYKNLFTTKELQELQTRFNSENAIKSYIPKTEKLVDKLIKKTGNAAALAANAAKFSASAVAISNNLKKMKTKPSTNKKAP